MRIAPQIFFVFALAIGPSARADWPMFGHDVGRTALTPGGATINKPVTRWRRYLGGALAPGGLLSADTDGDGITELVVANGGRVSARHDDDSLVWQSPLIDVQELIDVIDLDGDGQLDVIARSVDRVVVLAGKTGAVEWQSLHGKDPGYPLGAIGAVRLADLDGDGHEDLYVAGAFCGGSTNQDNRGSIAFGFRNGGTLATPKVLFETKASDRGGPMCGAYDLLADVDGDGKLEALSFGKSQVYAFDTKTGALKFASADLGPLPFQVPTVAVADLDGDGKKDLVLYTDNNAQVDNSRRVLAVGWHAVNGAPVFGKWWEHSVSDLVKDRHGFVDGALRDVDGDGKLDVTTSFYSGMTGRWSLHVYDARTGAEKVMLDDSGRLVGLVDIDPTHVGILTTTDGTDALNGYAVTAGAFSQLWSFDHTRTVVTVDTAVKRLRNDAGRVFLADACGDQRPELILLELDASNKPATLAAYQTGLDLGAARCPADYDVRSAGENFSAAVPIEGGHRLAAARSSGLLTTLAFQQGLVPTNLSIAGFDAPGVRLGGYYSGAQGRGPIPIAPSLGGKLGTPVVVTDSRGFLESLDVSAATLVHPAVVNWGLPSVTQASAFDILGDTTPEILGWHQNSIIVVDGATGVELRSYQVALASSQVESPNFDVLAADLDGDGKKDLVYQLFNFGTGNTGTRALSGATGNSLWQKGYDAPSAQCGVMSTSLVDLDGDSHPDVVTGACNGLAGLQGSTGNQLHLVAGKFDFMAMIVDADGDGKPDLLTSGQLVEPHAYRLDFSPWWDNTDLVKPLMPYRFAAVANCKTGVRYAGTQQASPLFFILDAKTGKTVNGGGGSVGVILAEGAAFPSEDAARAAGKYVGRLGNVTAAQSLRGPNTPTFLVGSTDGYLYALDACTGDLAWSLAVGSPVGQPIVADVRGTGAEEIVITAGDGYLYGVDQEQFPAPAWARDVDPMHGHPDDQVDTIDTKDTLYLSFADVPGATKYECAVLSASGAVLTQPEFVDCGAGTHTSISGLPLHEGSWYRQAVRAVGPSGTSIETFTRGVRIKGGVPIPDGGVGPTNDLSMASGADGHGEPDGDEPPPKGCSCEVGARPAHAPIYALLALAALLLLRRRSTSR